MYQFSLRKKKQSEVENKQPLSILHQREIKLLSDRSGGPRVLTVGSRYLSLVVVTDLHLAGPVGCILFSHISKSGSGNKYDRSGLQKVKFCGLYVYKYCHRE